MNANIYKTLQESMVSAMGLKVGDTVKITRKASDNELGWGLYWVSRLDPWVEYDSCIVEEIDNIDGIELSSDSCDSAIPGYKTIRVPIQVLVKIAPKLEEVDLGDYNAIIQKDGSVKVGCQHVSYDTLMDICDKARYAKNKSYKQ